MPSWNKLSPEQQFNEGLFAVTQAVLAAAAELRLKLSAEEAGRAARAAMIKLTNDGWSLSRGDAPPAE